MVEGNLSLKYRILEDVLRRLSDTFESRRLRSWDLSTRPFRRPHESPGFRKNQGAIRMELCLQAREAARFQERDLGDFS